MGDGTIHCVSTLYPSAILKTHLGCRGSWNITTVLGIYSGDIPIHGLAKMGLNDLYLSIYGKDTLNVMKN